MVSAAAPASRRAAAPPPPAPAAVPPSSARGAPAPPAASGRGPRGAEPPAPALRPQRPRSRSAAAPAPSPPLTFCRARARAAEGRGSGQGARRAGAPGAQIVPPAPRTRWGGPGGSGRRVLRPCPGASRDAQPHGAARRGAGAGLRAVAAPLPRDSGRPRPVPDPPPRPGVILLPPDPHLRGLRASSWSSDPTPGPLPPSRHRATGFCCERRGCARPIPFATGTPVSLGDLAAKGIPTSRTEMARDLTSRDRLGFGASVHRFTEFFFF